MPTQRYFDRYPRFPSNVEIEGIPTVNFEYLQSGSDAESRDLFQACRNYGLFLLDLTGSQEGETVLQDAERMFELNSALFSLGEEELNKHAWNAPKDLIGYKCAGKLEVGNGQVDVTEMYSLGQDDMLETAPSHTNPVIIDAHRSDYNGFIRRAYRIISVILRQLDEQLELSPGTLSSLCPLDKASDTSLRLLSSRPQPTVNSTQVALPEHTDIGIITMLFNVAGGLQILPAGSDNIDANWRYVRPLPGCAIINLGDTIVEWTGGLFRSPLHRVITAPGEQAGVTRQSLAYLIRPSYQESMRRLRGGNVIPQASEGENDEDQNVTEWATWRAHRIVSGEVKPQTFGGQPLQNGKSLNAAA